MIDQKEFFESLEFWPMEDNGIPYYMGPNGYRYCLLDSEESVIIRVSEPDSFQWKNLLILERVVPDADLVEMLKASLQNYLLLGDLYISAHNSYYAMADVTRAALGKSIGERELKNLCNIYYRAIRYGEKAMQLSETCKEVIRMASMPENQYVFPQLHRLLLQVPDAYYDFVFGMENNLSIYNDRQGRLYRYIQKYPYSSTIELIIFNSFLNGKTGWSDEEIHALAEEAMEDRIFCNFSGGLAKNETLMEEDKHGWRITGMFVRNLGYTFRRYKSLCLVDYMDVCIAGAILSEWDGETALLKFVINHAGNREGIRQELIKHQELVAQNAGYKKILIHCTVNNFENLKMIGYKNDESYADPLLRHRIAMIKELE